MALTTVEPPRLMQTCPGPVRAAAVTPVQEKLYSTPADVFAVYKALNPISPMLLGYLWLRSVLCSACRDERTTASLSH